MAFSYQKEYQEVYDRVDGWAAAHMKKIRELLPFNPLVVNTAFRELTREDAAGNPRNWQKTAELFESDPGLFTKFLNEANRVLREKGKVRWVIKNLTEAVSILGGRRTLHLLKTIITDELAANLRQRTYADFDLIWKESWYMAFAAQVLGREFRIESRTAFSLGLMANLGQLLMVNVYPGEYFFQVDNRLTDEYGFGGAERLAREKEMYKVSHNEVGYWLFRFLSLEPAYGLAAYWHEETNLNKLISDSAKLAALANRVARFYMTEAYFEFKHENNVSEDVENRFLSQRIRMRREIERVFDDEFSITRSQTVGLLDSVHVAVMGQLQRVQGQLKARDAALYDEAFRQIGETAENVFKRLLARLDGSIVPHLPFPVAVDYSSLLGKKLNSAEFHALLTSILLNFTAILTSATFANLYRLEREAFPNILAQALKNKRSARTTLGEGLALAADLGRYIKSRHPPERVSALVEYLLEKRNLLLSLCGFRAQSKDANVKKDLEKTLTNLEIALKAFAAMEPLLLNVLELDYVEEENAYRIATTDWMGLNALESRTPGYHRLEKPIARGSTQLLLKLGGPQGRTEKLPRFLVNRQCDSCRHAHYYVTDRVRIEGQAPKLRAFFELKPLSALDTCASVMESVL